MPRQKPIRILLVDEDWIYELSSLNAESKLLQKHSDKIHQLHYEKLQGIVGRCFVDEVLQAKKEADNGIDTENDWTDEIDKKYLEFLGHQDFRAWYSKMLEYLITVFSTSEFKGDGLVKYERQQDNYLVQNVSTKERKERQDSVLRYLPILEANLMEHVVKPNILLFNCLKTKFKSSEQVKKFELDYFVPVVGGDSLNTHLPSNSYQLPTVIQSLTSVSEETKQATYNYIASPLDGTFTVDYSELKLGSLEVDVALFNQNRQEIQDFEWKSYDGNFMKIWIFDYVNHVNLQGSIIIKER